MSKKYRILIVTTVPETLLTILAGQPRWLSQHFDVTLATSPCEDAAKVMKAEGLVVFPVRMTRKISPFSDVVAIWRLYRLIRRLRPDLVHSYTPKAGLVTMTAGMLARVPVRIHTFTGLIFPTATGMKRRILKRVDRLIAAAATHIVPEGRGVMRDLQRLGITRKPLRVLASGNIAGVNIDHFAPGADGLAEAAAQIPRALNIGESDFVFGYVGRMNRDKGLDELVAAFQSICDDRSRLICVGGYDATAPVSRKTRSALNADPKITLTGFQKDIRPLLAVMDVLILPSYREGFPNVLLEAGAMKRPVIATDVNGSNEIVVPGVTGSLVPPRDPAALAEAMLSIREMPEGKRNALGENARERVVRHFDRHHVRSELLLFYTQALQERNRAMVQGVQGNERKL